jgi:hypothetical protein
MLFLLAACAPFDTLLECDGCGGELVHLLDDDGRDRLDVEGSDPMPTDFAIWPVGCDEGILDGGATGWFVDGITWRDYPLEPGVLTGRMEQVVVVNRDWALTPGALYQAEVFMGRVVRGERGLPDWTRFIQAGRPVHQAATLEELCAVAENVREHVRR